MMARSRNKMSHKVSYLTLGVFLVSVADRIFY